MATINAQLEWLHDELFVARDRQGTTLAIGRSLGSEPEWHGVKASDLLLLSLIGCSAHDVVAILQKQKQQVRSFRVVAEGEQDNDPPWRFRKIRICYKLVGQNLNEGFIKRAIELSQDKYCSVYATLRDAVEITSDYEIESE